MPRGNVTPRKLSQARLSLMEKQVKQETSMTALQKMKQALTGKPVDTGTDWERVKKLRAAIRKRSDALIANSSKLDKGKV